MFAESDKEVQTTVLSNVVANVFYKVPYPDMKLKVQHITNITKGCFKFLGWTFEEGLIEKFTGEIKNVLKDYKGIHLLSDEDITILNKNNWLMPFEYSYKEIARLNNEDFKKMILEHFTEDRVNKMFNSISSNTSDDVKKLVTQVQQNYFLGNYAICNNALMSILEKLSFEFLMDNNGGQTPYFVFNGVLECYDLSKVDKNCEEYLYVKLFTNFCDNVFTTYNNLRRNAEDEKYNYQELSNKYSNSQLEVLRLANTVRFMQNIVRLSNLREMFVAYSQEKDSDKLHFKLNPGYFT